MSHVTTIKVKINSLEALKRACKAMGLDFRENQKHYKWFGTHVGDYPIPAGFSKEDLGKCEHAIGISNNSQAYEIGVVKARDGDGYTLIWDFYAGGRGLQKVVGDDCCDLVQEYAKEIAVEEVEAMGFDVSDIDRLENGDIELNCVSY